MSRLFLPADLVYLMRATPWGWTALGLAAGFATSIQICSEQSGVMLGL